VNQASKMLAIAGLRPDACRRGGARTRSVLKNGRKIIALMGRGRDKFVRKLRPVSWPCRNRCGSHRKGRPGADYGFAGCPRRPSLDLDLRNRPATAGESEIDKSAVHETGHRWTATTSSPGKQGGRRGAQAIQARGHIMTASRFEM